MPSNRVLVEQSSISKVLILTPGLISPDVLADWERHAVAYFEEKTIDAANQVCKVQWGLQDPSIQNWFTVDSTRFRLLSFAEFMLKFRSCWLEPDWHNKLSSHILTSHQGEGSFWEWSNKLRMLNAQLFGMDNWLDDDAF